MCIGMIIFTYSKDGNKSAKNAHFYPLLVIFLPKSTPPFIMPSLFTFFSEKSTPLTYFDPLLRVFPFHYARESKSPHLFILWPFHSFI